MKDIARRFAGNPLLLPRDLKPSNEGLQIICLLNPGVFRFGNKTWLLIRVAEGALQKEGSIFFPVLNATGNPEIIEVLLNDPDLVANDARVVSYKGLDYLTTISHLRLLASEDGVVFREQPDYPALLPQGQLERFGIEDARVSQIGNEYFLTYTAVSDQGVGVALRTTRDWRQFEHHGMILPPHNKDCAIFQEKINGRYYCLHRPSSVEIGGNYIWLAESSDGRQWGNHRCLIKTRPGLWDSARVGAGAAPIPTEQGLLAIYHGADSKHRYCLGAFLIDRDEPWRVISRTLDPIIMPVETYELSGFFGHVVFTNGHVVEGDRITLYYGAADEFVCGAYLSIKEILNRLI